VGYRLGVDLGTTYTAAAVNVGGRVEMLGLGIRAMQVPSVVFVRTDGGVVVGEAAEQEGAADPGRVVREFKRRVGDAVPLVVGGSPFSAQALTARLLAWVVGMATERQGGPPEHVCVTYPANWGPFKRDLLGQAIEMAGLRGTPTSTRTEPEAAAIAYASRDRVAEGDRIAVYDLGGGTFDAAVLVREGDGFRLAGAPEGVEQLGGIDFDEAVFRHVLDSLGADVAGLDDRDPATTTGLARLRRDCVEAKEVLSFSTETAVAVALPGINRSVRLTRGELDDMLRPAIGETVAAMRRVLDSAKVGPGDLSAIVLVGGSSRIPLVSQMLSAEFGRPLALDNHPKHDVALGAAIRDTPAARPAAAPPATADASAHHAAPTAVGPAMETSAPVWPGSPAASDAAMAAPAPTGVQGDPDVGSAAVPTDRPAAGPSPDWRPPARVGPLHHPASSAGGTGATARSRRRKWAPPVFAAALLLIVAAASLLMWLPRGEPVQREAVSSIGALPPFMPGNGDPGTPVVSVPDVVNTAAVTGDTPGLYGGTRSDTCNPQAISTYLQSNPDKAAAWATAMALPAAQVGPFLTSLTPVTLRTDTAVTNHGFKNGVATPFQSVLQAGTAVLVDPQGVPRVRCFCGNPLGEPDRQTSARYTGAAWDGFSGEAVTVVAKAPAEVRDFVVVEPDTNEVVNRPRGTSGEKDQPADPVVANNVRRSLIRADTAEPDNDPAPDIPDQGGTAKKYQYQQNGGLENPVQPDGEVPVKDEEDDSQQVQKDAGGAKTGAGHGEDTVPEGGPESSQGRQIDGDKTDGDKTESKTESKTEKQTEGETGTDPDTPTGPVVDPEPGDATPPDPDLTPPGAPLSTDDEFTSP
jgi:actin-like ATPase involved in cell morphogenesis